MVNATVLIFVMPTEHNKLYIYKSKSICNRGELLLQCYTRFWGWRKKNVRTLYCHKRLWTIIAMTNALWKRHYIKYVKNMYGKIKCKHNIRRMNKRERNIIWISYIIGMMSGSLSRIYIFNVKCSWCRRVWLGGFLFFITQLDCTWLV